MNTPVGKKKKKFIIGHVPYDWSVLSKNSFHWQFDLIIFFQPCSVKDVNAFILIVSH